MGFFDWVTVKHPAFVCSEGHDLSDEPFQTHDLGETMGSAIIGERLERNVGAWGAALDGTLSATIATYCECRQCPAFVQARTGNLIGCWVQFEVEIVEDVVRSVKRTSIPTAKWIASATKQKHLKGAQGPMPFAEARRVVMAQRRKDAENDGV